jgi:hypothetical protein
MVPEEFTVNDRLLCPPGATTLDHVSLIVDDVLLGVVGVLSPPQPTATSAITSHRDTETQRQFLLCVSATLRLVSVNDAAFMGV